MHVLCIFSLNQAAESYEHVRFEFLVDIVIAEKNYVFTFLQLYFL